MNFRLTRLFRWIRNESQSRSYISTAATYDWKPSIGARRGIMEPLKSQDNPGFVSETSQDSDIRNPLQAMLFAHQQIRKHAEGTKDTLTLTFVSMAERGLQKLAANILQQVQAEVKRVLIVEDDEDIGAMITAIAETNGLEFRLVTNGKDALETVSEFNPDVVVLDIGPPKMTGYEVAEKLRQGGFKKRIVAFTGYGRPADRERSNLAGINDYIVKPADPDELVAAIRGK